MVQESRALHVPADPEGELVLASPLRSFAAVTGIAVLLGLLVGYWIAGPRHATGDTTVIVNGTVAVRACVEAKRFIGCGRSEEELDAAGRMRAMDSAVGPYPLVQYLPAALLLASPLSREQILEALSALNVAAFLAMLVVLYVVSTRTGNRAWGPALVLLMTAGPLLFYANSTFGEMLAAFLIVLYIATILLKSHWALVATTAWMAGITKETAVPYLLAIGLIGLLGRRTHDHRTIRPQLAGMVLGAILAVGTNALFNVFRFGTPLNRDYLNAPDVPFTQSVRYFGGLLFAPNGGLFVFWPAAAALLVAVGVCAFLAWRRKEKAERWVPSAALLATFILLTYGLASWYAPFGWHAWGPRLTIPWVPAFLLLGVALAADDLSRLARALTNSRPALLLTAVVIWISALSHFGFLWHREVFRDFFKTSAICPWYPPRFTGDMYFRCTDHLAWHGDPLLISALDGVVTWPGALFAGAFLAGTVALLTLMRNSLEAEGMNHLEPRTLITPSDPLDARSVSVPRP